MERERERVPGKRTLERSRRWRRNEIVKERFWPRRRESKVARWMGFPEPTLSSPFPLVEVFYKL